MFVEVKTHGATLRPDQRDTLGLLSQALRNRRSNRHARRRGRHVRRHTPPAVAWSHLHGRDIALRMLGGHLLELSGGSPADSDIIRWDGHLITEADLVQLLRFEVDPDKFPLQPMDWRRRWRSVRTSLFGHECSECGEEVPEDAVHCPVCDVHHIGRQRCQAVLQ
jgi:hypothetical protein